MNKRLKIILFVIILVVLVAIGYSALSQAGKDSTIEVGVAPSGSTVKLDGKGIKAGKHTVKPGSHQVSASRKGFASLSNTVSVEKDETRYIGIVLVPNSPETKDWYKNNSEDGRLAEQINGKILDQTSSDLVKKYPIIKKLPLVDLLYRIDYGASKKSPNDSQSIAIYVRYYSEAAKTDAISWLKYMGYDPDKSETIYINQTSQ